MHILTTPKKLIEEVGQLFSLPEVCIQVNHLLDSPNSSAEAIAAVISKDTALSAHLLKIVNSAFYGLPGKIDTISRAVTIIGTKDLRNLAVVASTCDMFAGIPPELVNMQTFWQGSITCGVVARKLATHCHVLNAERLFVMGMLHDIGRLVIYQQLPIPARDILLISQGREDLIIPAELEVLGFTHHEVGYELAKQWQLPESLANVIRWHHYPDRAPAASIDISLIHIASVISDQLLWNDANASLAEAVSPHAWRTSGLDEQTCTELTADIGTEIREIYSILMANQDSALN